MKKILNFWLLVLLMGCLSLATVSCSTDDNIADGQQSSSTSDKFFSSEVNALVDANYQEVLAKGYGKLVIPATMYDKNMICLPQTHCGVMDIMNGAGYKTYVNGGAVRDGILGTLIHDVDFSTDATPEQMIAIVPNSEIVTTGGGQVVQAHHADGDVTDMVPIHGIDSRLQGKPGMPTDGAYGQTYSKSLLDDTYTRDLTINSIYYDYPTGDIIDFHGGLHDLREQVIRTVYDANLMYPINPSALIRTVRFAARYGYSIDRGTTQAIADHMHYCDALRPSLVNYYVTKGFTDGCGKRTFQYYLDYGILDRYATMLKDYSRNKSYTGPLFTTLDYIDEQQKATIELGIAAVFLPCLEDALGKKESTLDNIIATWNQLEESSGQKAHFELDDYAGTKTDVMNIWYLYKQMISDDAKTNYTKRVSVLESKYFSQALLLLEGYAKSNASLQTYADYWKNPSTPQFPDGFFSTAVNKLIDENYGQLSAKGWAELRIPAELFDHKSFAIPANALGDIEYVIKKGYKAYIYGGTIRDAVWGQLGNDVDFVSDAMPERLVEIVPNTKLFTAPNGYKVAQAWHGDDDRTDMGTMRAIYWYMRGKPGIPESSYPVTGEDINVYSQDLWEDSYSRDLTINGLYYDYSTGDLLDFHGGLHDMREGIIRTIVHPDLVFPYNPSALIRAVRFAGHYGFDIEPVTSQGIHDHLPECDALGASGIAYDMIKGFHDGNMTTTYRLYKDYNFLGRYFLTLKDVLETSEYDNYVKKVYAYLDAKVCKEYSVTLAALFSPVMQKAMEGKTATLAEVTATWNNLEHQSGQDQWFEIPDDVKAAMCQVWYLVGQMTSVAVVSDSAKVAAIRADAHFANAALLLHALAETDSNLVQYAKFWS